MRLLVQKPESTPDRETKQRTALTKYSDDDGDGCVLHCDFKVERLPQTDD